MSEISNLGDEILAHLERLGRNLEIIVSPPLKTEKIRQEQYSRGIVFPDEIIDLYSWRNGYVGNQENVLGDFQFFPGFLLIPFGKALEEFDIYSKDERWNRSWFPVFENQGGDFYVVICDPNSEDFGAVVGFILGQPDQLVEYESLTALFKTINLCYQRSAFFVRDDGFIDADDDLMYEISQEVQPNFMPHLAKML